MAIDLRKSFQSAKDKFKKNSSLSELLDGLYNNNNLEVEKNQYVLTIDDSILENSDLVDEKGFVFDILKQVEKKQDTEYAEYFAENAKVFQDHGVNKPLVYTIQGIKGFNVYKPAKSIDKALERVNVKQNILTSFLPPLDVGALQLANKAILKTEQAVNYFDGVLTQVKSFFDFVDQNLSNQDILVKTEIMLELLQLNKIPLRLSIPRRGKLNNYFCITSITKRTEQGTYDNILDLSLTIQEIRTVDTVVFKKRKATKNAKLKNALAQQTNSGSANGVTTDKNVSFFKTLVNQFS